MTSIRVQISSQAGFLGTGLPRAGSVIRGRFIQLPEGKFFEFKGGKIAVDGAIETDSDWKVWRVEYQDREIHFLRLQGRIENPIKPQLGRQDQLRQLLSAIFDTTSLKKQLISDKPDLTFKDLLKLALPDAAKQIESLHKYFENKDEDGFSKLKELLENAEPSEQKMNRLAILFCQNFFEGQENLPVIATRTDHDGERVNWVFTELSFKHLGAVRLGLRVGETWGRVDVWLDDARHGKLVLSELKESSPWPVFVRSSPEQNNFLDWSFEAMASPIQVGYDGRV